MSAELYEYEPLGRRNPGDPYAQYGGEDPSAHFSKQPLPRCFRCPNLSGLFTHPRGYVCWEHL